MRRTYLAQGLADCGRISLFEGWTRLTFGPDGRVGGRAHEGFFDCDTLYVSELSIRIREEQPKITFAAQERASLWSAMALLQGSMEEGNLPEGTVPRGSLECRIVRQLNGPLNQLPDGTWQEKMLIRNNSGKERSFPFEIELVCPLGDIQYAEEMKAEKFEQLEGVAPRYDDSASEGWPVFHYRQSYGTRRHAPTTELKKLYDPTGTGADGTPREGDPVVRGLQVSLKPGTWGSRRAPQVSRLDLGSRSRIELSLQLGPGEARELILEFTPQDRRVRHLEKNVRPLVSLRASHPCLNLILEQARTDLQDLALPMPGRTGSGSSPMMIAAGVPRYVGLFGRDALTAAWQCSLLSPSWTEEALSGMSLLRGVCDDPWRDERPGQMPHELRLNPCAEAGATNREVYYGDVVSTTFWIVTLASAFHWDGSRDLIRRHLPTLDSCVDWLVKRLAEGEGYISYVPAMASGNRHHAWKDSGDAIVDGQGRIVSSPLATAEVQGYAHLALLGAAELYATLGRFKDAARRWRDARELKRRFNRDFWMPDRAYYAVALRPGGVQVDSITSNIGHCMGCGIIDRERIAAVVARLFSPDLYSGWGIRTLSRDNPAYDPYSYHRGTVWPVENATIAGALRMCGFDAQALMLTEAQFEAASLFPCFRLPEAMSGHQRTNDYTLPGLYPDANSLQAWSVSAVFFLLMVILGIRPFAPLKMLWVKPDLPEWLDWIEVRDLKVGESLVDLRFWRDRDGRSRWAELSKVGTLHIVEQPGELDANFGVSSRLLMAALRPQRKSA